MYKTLIDWQVPYWSLVYTLLRSQLLGEGLTCTLACIWLTFFRHVRVQAHVHRYMHGESRNERCSHANRKNSAITKYTHTVLCPFLERGSIDEGCCVKNLYVLEDPRCLKINHPQILSNCMKLARIRFSLSSREPATMVFQALDFVVWNTT